MKKGIILLTALLVMATSAFAQVTAVKEGDVAKVTWTYTPDYDAGFVGLVGDFQGWNLDGATPMTKNADGSWSVTLDLAVDDEIKYKFNVDGEWTEDPNAIATLDDGFGGLNGYVVVAEVLAAGTGAVVPTGPKVVFGNYTEASLDTIFLTEGVGDKSNKGVELDQVNLNLKSYWKFDGYVMEGVKIFAELAVIDNGSIGFYRSNPNGALDPLVTWADGLQSLGDAIFNPYTAFAGQRPYMGHWKTTFETPFLNIFQAYNFGKGTLREEKYVYKTVTEKDSGDGIVELTNPETYDFGVVTLDFLVGPNKRDGVYGLYNWVDFSLLEMVDGSLQFDIKSAEGDDLFLFWDEADMMVSLGLSTSVADLLDITFEGLANFYSYDTDIEIADAVAAALILEHTNDVFGLTFKGKYGGDSAKTLFGNTDEMEVGKLFFGLDSKFTGISDLTVGLDASAGFDNYTSEIADGETPGQNYYVKPYVDLLGLAGLVDLSLYGKVNLDIIEESTDADQPLGIKVPEVGIKASLADIAMFTGIDTYIAVLPQTGDWDATDDAYADNGIDATLITRLAMEDNLSFFVGGIFRGQGADETDEDYAEVNVLGLTAAVNKQTDWKEFKSPRLYAMIDYNFAPWDGEKPTLNLDDYKPDDTGAGNGQLVVRVGTIWDF